LLLALHIGFSNVLDVKLPRVYHLTLLLRVMRFRFRYFFILALYCIAQHSRATEVVPESPAGNSPTAQAENGSESPAVIEADSMAGKAKGQIEATGNATLRQGGQSIRADTLLFNQNTHEVDAQGGVMLEQDGNTIGGPHLQFNMDTGAGNMEQPQYYLKENDAHGSADMLHILDRRHYSLDKATYTTCPAGNQDWYLKMGTLDLDREQQIGAAWNTTVNFKGVPILYSPWMDFPLGNQRKSGLLSPIFGSTVNGGTELTLPYYWNIAPNFDATIAPREMTKRGLMLNNEFRYLGTIYGGELHYDVLPNDKIANLDRTLFSLNHNQTFGGNLFGYINYTRVSDDAYFRDLGNSLSATSQANLLQEAGLNLIEENWTSTLRVQKYQTLQDPAAPIIVPYARMPQVTVDAQQTRSGVNFAFAGEYADYVHPTEVNGSRLALIPSISRPLVKDSAYYVTPKLALNGTYYSMGANNYADLPNASRIMPIFSVDSGASFERESNALSGDYLQTLEPRAFYVYIPYRNQSELPNFDSALANFDFTQIFTENRFSGNDRIGDANQVTLAATSRYLDQNSGAERLKVMVGERFSFITPQVNLATPATSAGRSDILLAVSGQRTKAWSLDSEFQYDPNESHLQLFNFTSHYHPEAGKTFNMGYRIQRDTMRQVDFSTQWPLINHWEIVGRWNYSLRDSRILEGIAGLEYNQSCWTLRIVTQRFATATQQTNTGFFVQLDLSGLVRVGSDPLSLLKQSVPGYTTMNEDNAGKAAQAVQ
jgi:LPS-assembly protein